MSGRSLIYKRRKSVYTLFPVASPFAAYFFTIYLLLMSENVKFPIDKIRLLISKQKTRITIK